MTGIVLKYRVPSRAGQPGMAGGLADAQRAMSLVRSKAGELGIDPGRIGMLGFSAGGIWRRSPGPRTTPGLRGDRRSRQDQLPAGLCHPDLSAWLGGKTRTNWWQRSSSTEQTPPMFLAHAGDDPIKVDASVVMYLAHQRAKVPAELHVYATGGHGFRPVCRAMILAPTGPALRGVAAQIKSC